MTSKTTPIASIEPGTKNLTIKARIVRLWWMPPFNNDKSSEAAEGMYDMVLCDKEVFLKLVFFLILFVYYMVVCMANLNSLSLSL